MSLHIGDDAPDFTAETTQGTISFHNWIGDGWAILFSHPKDFTPVCTTELGYMAGLESDFAKRNCKVIGLSVDSVEDHCSLVQGHRGDPRARCHLSDHRRQQPGGGQSLRHAAPERQRRGEEPDRDG